MCYFHFTMAQKIIYNCFKPALLRSDMNTAAFISLVKVLRQKNFSCRPSAIKTRLLEFICPKNTGWLMPDIFKLNECGFSGRKRGLFKGLDNFTINNKL